MVGTGNRKRPFGTQIPETSVAGLGLFLLVKFTSQINSSRHQSDRSLCVQTQAMTIAKG